MELEDQIKEIKKAAEAYKQACLKRDEAVGKARPFQDEASELYNTLKKLKANLERSLCRLETPWIVAPAKEISKETLNNTELA